MSIKRNIFFNGIANVLQKTVRIADQLLLVPFFLVHWGAEYYGEWLTLSIIPSVLAFSDLGFGTSAGNAFVLAHSGKDYQKASNIYQTGFVIITASILLGIVVSAVFMLVANLSGVLAKSIIQPQDAIWALIFMMGSRLVNFYNQLYEAMFRCKHKAATATNLSTLEGFLRIGLGIAVLMSGYGVVAYALSNVVVAVIFNIFFALAGLHVIGKLPKGYFDKAEANSICGKGLGFMASPIWQAIYFQGSTFVVRVVIGAEGVAIFNTVRTVCRSVNQIYSIVNASVFPELQLAIGQQNFVKAKKIFIRSIQFVLISALGGIIFLCTIGPSLYVWWTNSQLTVSNGMWYIFMTGILFNAIWWTAGIIFRAINEPYRFAIYGLFSSCVSTLSSYFLSRHLGLMGAAIGYVVLDVIMAFLVLPYSCKCIKIKLTDLFQGLSHPTQDSLS